MQSPTDVASASSQKSFRSTPRTPTDTPSDAAGYALAEGLPTDALGATLDSRNTGFHPISPLQPLRDECSAMANALPLVRARLSSDDSNALSRHCHVIQALIRDISHLSPNDEALALIASSERMCAEVSALVVAAHGTAARPPDVLLDVSPDHISHVSPAPIDVVSFGTTHAAMYFDRRVALKRVIKMGRRDLRVARGEIAVLLPLRHPHLCACIGLLRAEAYDAIVTEMMPLTTFTSVLATATLRARLEVVARVASALAYLHKHGVVHNDLKSENVMVDLASMEVKLIDYGVAATKAAAQRHAGVTLEEVGSLRWTASELIRGDVTTGSNAADVYSLGMVLVEALTGDIPFGSKCPSDEAVAAAKRNVLPCLNGPEVPCRVAHECLNADSGQRPPASSVAESLHRFLREWHTCGIGVAQGL